MRVVVSGIRVEAPGTPGTELVELADGEAVVLGRAPDPKHARLDADLQVRTHVVPAPSVSSTHAIAWRRDGRVHLRDLGSRNGTWLRLTEDATLASASAPVDVRLGFPSPSTLPKPPIEPAHFADPADFGASVARAVEAWLAANELPVRATVSRSDGNPGGMSLPLASGEHLVLEAAQTIDDRLHDLMPAVSRYVASQNAVFASEEETRNDGMILASPAIRLVHRRVVEAAMQHTARLVLLGPSGTGKERLARAYHRHLGRGGPLVTVNCATLSRERMVADLFGAEAGAYTGAQRAVTGAVERADGGTLFLDEIGEMPLDVQSQLLRFLDTGEYQRLGSTGVTRTASVCVVAATNRDLRAMVNAGTFRLDLFFRLALEVIEVPALRERFRDAVAYLASQRRGDASALDALQPAALDLLRQHAWPGNFRELLNLVQRLPRALSFGSIDADTIRRILGAGAVRVPEPPPPPTEPDATGDWLEWVRKAANAYCTDRGEPGPRTWSDMTTFVEQYLKPFALVHMAGVANTANADAVVTSNVADTLKADRGTVVKQVRRYLAIRGG